ncbi:MAG: hypothetical protein SFU25_07645 [Candidatus Caenarcaniphilales bacterium]|nr:hypothetical protein [Candidatus Caenarcaniphilales bacterium]
MPRPIEYLRIRFQRGITLSFSKLANKADKLSSRIPRVSNLKRGLGTATSKLVSRANRLPSLLPFLGVNKFVEVQRKPIAEVLSFSLEELPERLLQEKEHLQKILDKLHEEEPKVNNQKLIEEIKARIKSIDSVQTRLSIANIDFVSEQIFVGDSSRIAILANSVHQGPTGWNRANDPFFRERNVAQEDLSWEVARVLTRSGGGVLRMSKEFKLEPNKAGTLQLKSGYETGKVVFDLIPISVNGKTTYIGVVQQLTQELKGIGKSGKDKAYTDVIRSTTFIVSPDEKDPLQLAQIFGDKVKRMMTVVDSEFNHGEYPANGFQFQQVSERIRLDSETPHEAEQKHKQMIEEALSHAFDQYPIDQVSKSCASVESIAA